MDKWIVDALRIFFCVWLLIENFQYSMRPIDVIDDRLVMPRLVQKRPDNFQGRRNVERPIKNFNEYPSRTMDEWLKPCWIVSEAVACGYSPSLRYDPNVQNSVGQRNDSWMDSDTYCGSDKQKHGAFCRLISFFTLSAFKFNMPRWTFTFLNSSWVGYAKQRANNEHEWLSLPVPSRWFLARPNFFHWIVSFSPKP